MKAITLLSFFIVFLALQGGISAQDMINYESTLAPGKNNTGYVYIYGTIFKPNGEVVKRFVNTTTGRPEAGYADFYNFWISKITDDSSMTYNVTAASAAIGEKDGNNAIVREAGKMQLEFPGYAGDCDSVIVWIWAKMSYTERANWFSGYKTYTKEWNKNSSITLTRRSDGPFFDEYYKYQATMFDKNNKKAWQNVQVRVHGKEVRVWNDVESHGKHLNWWESFTNWFGNIWNSIIGYDIKNPEFFVFVDAAKGVNYADFLVRPAICASYSTPEGESTSNCWIATKIVDSNPSHMGVKKDISYAFLDILKTPTDGNFMFPVPVGVESYDKAGNIISQKVNPKVDIACNPQGTNFYMATEYSYDDETNTYRESSVFRNGELHTVYDMPDDKHIAVATRDPFNDFLFVTEHDGVAVCETWNREGVDIENRYFILQESKLYECYQGALGPVQGNLDATNQNVAATNVMNAVVGTNEEVFKDLGGAPAAMSTASAAIGSPDGVFTQLGRGGQITVTFDVALDVGEKLVIYEHSGGSEAQFEFNPGSLTGASFTTSEGEQYTIEAASSDGGATINGVTIKDSSPEYMIQETYYIEESVFVLLPYPHYETKITEKTRWIPDPSKRPEVFDPNMHAFLNIDAVVLTNVAVNSVGIIAADGQGFLYTLRQNLDETYNFIYKVGNLVKSDSEIWYYDRESNYDLWVISTENMDAASEKISQGYDSGMSYYYRTRWSDPPYTYGTQGYKESSYQMLVEAKDSCDMCTINISFPPHDTGAGVCDIQTGNNSREVVNEFGIRRSVTEVFINVHEGTSINDIALFSVDAAGNKSGMCFENWDQLNHFALEPTRYKPYVYVPTIKYTRSEALAWINHDWDEDRTEPGAETFGGGFPTNTVIGRHYGPAGAVNYGEPAGEFTPPGMEYPPYAYDKNTMDSRNFMWSIRRLALTYKNEMGETVEYPRLPGTTPWKRINGGGQNGYQDYLDYYFDGKWGNEYMDSGSYNYQDYVDALVSYQDGQFFQPGAYKFDDGGIYQIKLEARYKYIDWTEMRAVMDTGTPRFWWNEPEYIRPLGNNWEYMIDTEEVIVTAYRPEPRMPRLKVSIADNHTDNADEAQMATFIPFDMDSDNVPEFHYAEINEDIEHTWIAKVWQLDELSDTYQPVQKITFVPNRRQQVEVVQYNNDSGGFDGKTVRVDRQIDKGDGITVGDGSSQDVDTVIEFDDLETDQITEALDDPSNPGQDLWSQDAYTDDTTARRISDRYTGVCAIGSDGEPMQYEWHVTTVPWDAKPYAPPYADSESGEMVDDNTPAWEHNYYSENDGTGETGILVADRVVLRSDLTSDKWKGNSTTELNHYLNYQPFDSRVYETVDEGEGRNGYDMALWDALKPTNAGSVTEIKGVVDDETRTRLDTASGTYGNIVSDFKTVFSTPILPMRYRITFIMRYKRVDYKTIDNEGNAVAQEDNPMAIKDDYRPEASAQIINYDCEESWETISTAVDVFVKDRTLPRVYFENDEGEKSGGTTGDMYPKTIKVVVEDNNPFDGVWPNISSTGFEIGTEVPVELGWNNTEGSLYRGSHAYIVYPLEHDRNQTAYDVRMNGNSVVPDPRYKWGRPELQGNFGLGDFFVHPDDVGIMENGYVNKGCMASKTTFTLHTDMLFMPSFEEGILDYYVVAEDGCHNYFNGTIMQGDSRLATPYGGTEILRPFAEGFTRAGDDDYVTGEIKNGCDHNRVEIHPQDMLGIHAAGVPNGFDIDDVKMKDMHDMLAGASPEHPYLQKAGLQAHLHGEETYATPTGDFSPMGICMGKIEVVDNDPPEMWFRITNPKRLPKESQITYYCFDKARVDGISDFGDIHSGGEEEFNDIKQRSRAFFDETVVAEDQAMLILQPYGEVMGDANIDPHNQTSRRGRMAVAVLGGGFRYNDPHYPLDLSYPDDIDLTDRLNEFIPGGMQPASVDEENIVDLMLPVGGTYDEGASEAKSFDESVFSMKSDPVNVTPLVIDEDIRVILELWAVDNINDSDLPLSLKNMVNEEGYLMPEAGTQSFVSMTNENTPGFDWNNDLIVDDAAVNPYGATTAYKKGFIVFRESTRNEKGVYDYDTMNQETVTVMVVDRRGNVRAISFPIIIMDTQMIDTLIEEGRTRDRFHTTGGGSPE